MKVMKLITVMTLDASLNKFAIAMILDPTVERTRMCMDGCTQQGVTTLRTFVRKKEQRSCVQPAMCSMVRSGFV